MPRGESPIFLHEKYADLPGSKPVERAVKKTVEAGKPGPATKQGRVEVYMEHLEDLTEDERDLARLKEVILKRFSINTRSEARMKQLAEDLYESEKRIAIEQGRGADITRLESQGNIAEKYRPLILEKAEIQRKTLSSWLDELEQNDAKHPMWFRYFVVRNLEKMGTLDKEKATYSKRTPKTVAAFPELNHEALGWVYKLLTEGVDPEDHFPEDKQKALEQLIKAKDFPKLYAFAQIETAGKLNRESIVGEWRKYDKGTDWRPLERDLKGKGTGWCTAEGSAQSHLQSGDFYVYYTKSPKGYTEPRVAIRMEGDHVAEVRGVNHRQALEPELVDIASAQYRTLPGGESYDKKASDMKAITLLMKKQEQGKPFTKDDLIFLYEINAPIEGFGYDKDPRVAELRKQRNPKEDAPILFECASNQIAWSKNEVNDQTKAYVGPLFPKIFETLGHLEHIYTSFPEGKIRREQIVIGGSDVAQLEAEFKQAGMKIYDYALAMMKHKDFTTLKTPEQADLVRLKVRDLGFDNGATTDQIYAKAQEFGLELCPAEVGPHYRLSYTDQPMGEWVRIAMKQIAGPDGLPLVFRVARGVRTGCISTAAGRPFNEWSPDDEFVFRLPASPSASNPKKLGILKRLGF